MALNRLRSVAPYGALLAISLSLRLYGLDWGAYHPDEWAIDHFARGLALPGSIGEFFSPDSPLNPQWFSYGSLPLVLLAAIAGVGDALRGFVDFIPSNVVLWRGASGLADAVTLILVVRIGRAVYGPAVGFLAGGLYALAVLPIQLSHYSAVDPLLTTFLTASLLSSLYFVQSRRTTAGYAACLFLGLALATKATAIVFAAPAALAWVSYVWQARRDNVNPGETRRRVLAAVGGVGFTLAAFVVGQPYAVIDFATFRADVWEQTQMGRGVIEFPFTIQYVNTTPWLFHLRNIVVWGLGIPLGIAALAGLVLMGARSISLRRGIEILLVLSLLLPFLWIGAQQVKFMRYMLPLYPVLCIAAAVVIIVAMAQLSRMKRLSSWAPAALAGVIIIPTAFYALAFATVFAVDHPVDRISGWITENVPRNERIATESWDQRFHGEHIYNIEQVEPYWPDDEAKIAHLTEILERSDYIYLFSHRAYGSLSRLPERYPIMRAYYAGLFDGRLGFETARVESTYPSLLGVSFADETIRNVGFTSASPEALGDTEPGISLNLGSADESFTVYERPKPILFKKIAVLSPQDIRAILAPDGVPQPGEPQPVRSSLLMNPELAQAQNEGGTWTDIMPVTGRGTATEVALWLLAFQIISLAGLPLAMRLFRSLPDRGFLLGKILSLLVVSYAAWMLAALQLVAFSRTSVLLAILALVAVSIVVAYGTRRELLGVIKEKWRWFLTMEMLFLAVFLALVALKAANPDLWHQYRGGEKPMDVSYLTAVARSSFMPPYDPWFAGGHLNYYYFGHFIVATLIRLTGAVPEYAVNLAIPLFWTMTFGAAFSIAFNLAEATKVRISAVRWLPIGTAFAGLAAGLMVAIAGNLDGLLQVIPTALDSIQQAVRESNSGFGGTILSAAQSVVPAITGENFDFWRSSRMVDIAGTISITEFPFFSYLFADPHAHVYAMPLALLAAGLSVALAFGLYARRGLVSLALPLGALALTLGALFAAHAWDYPTYLGIAAATVFLARLARGDHPARALAWGAVAAGVLVLASLALFAPFHAANESFYTEIVRSNEQTPIRSVLAIFGLPLLIATAAYRPALALALGRSNASVRGMAQGLWRGRIRGSFAAQILLSLIFGIVLLIVAAGVFAALGSWDVPLNFTFMGFLAVGAGIISLSARSPFPLRLAYGGVALALLMIATVDVLAVNDHLVRMNTIFRVYLQAWILLGLSGGYLLWWLIRRDGGTIRMPGIGSAYRFAFYAALAILALGASIYPLLGTRARLADRFDASIPLTLDGTAFMASSSYIDVDDTEIVLRYELEALLWLRENVEGIPVVAEAAPTSGTPYYRIQSRAAMYTGLPVIIGWPWHQTQQRGIGVAEPEIYRRQAAVGRIFGSGDTGIITDVLREFDVRYVIVGQTEKAYYPAHGIQALEEHPLLRPVYENALVRIYQVADA